jgi:hypothetical protein
VADTLERLVERGFVETGDDLGLSATAPGRLASKYYLRLDTAARFHRIAGEDPDEDAILRAVAGAGEFDSVTARSNERDAVDAVLAGADELTDGQRKVLAILQSAAGGSMPAELRSDAWVIEQNALRLLSALRAYLERFAGPAAANRAARLAARVETGVDADAVGLTAVDGVGAGRAETLAADGHRSPADLVAAGTDRVAAAGLPEGVADRVVENARDSPAPTVEWGDVPERIAEGENELCEVTVRNAGGGASAGLRVTVNGNEMTARETYLDTTETLPVAVFGAPGVAELELAVHCTFPDLPLHPVVDTRTVRVE